MTKSLLILYLICGVFATFAFFLIGKIWGVLVLALSIAGGIFIFNQYIKNPLFSVLPNR